MIVSSLLINDPAQGNTLSQYYVSAKHSLEQSQQIFLHWKAADSVNYFVSGKGDMEAYDPECLFADPFAGFNGVQRFKQNVSNLGGLM